ncbi:N-acetylmuramoyl-L-alanine amidase [Erysipelotrichaceae bacterium HCN-30851]
MKPIKILSCIVLLLFAGIFTLWKCYTPNLEEKDYINNVQAASYQNDSTVIVLDAGHGGYDNGSLAYDGTMEKDITLAITLLVGEYLNNAGYQVVYTRTSDEVIWSNDNLDDLSTRVQIAEDVNADYFISIHLNAGQYGDDARGFEAYTDFEDEEILHMIESIEENLTQLSYTQNRDIKSTEESSLYVIDKNSIPAMLLELGFITDYQDVSYLTNQTGQENIANAIARGILANL